MAHWQDQMIDRPAPDDGAAADDGAYITGWTISGIAVLGTIVAVWLLGI